MNYFNLVGMYVTSKTGQEGIVKSVEKKGDKYFLHLIKKHGYAWFEISLLNGAYQYKNINGYDYDELEDLFANCIEGEVSNIAISILKENQELKKQLKPNYYVKGLEGTLKEYQQEMNNVLKQQKEFIKYLEDMLDAENDIFSVVRVKDVLSKYKEIIGDDNSEIMD